MAWTMSGLTDALGKQYGPLPLGGWILAGAGGVAVATVVRRRSLVTVAADDQATQAANAADGLYLNGEGGSTSTNPGAGNLYQPPIYGDGTLDDVEKPTTNAEWRTKAVTVLAQNGYNGSAANYTLTRYINGYTIKDASNQAMVDAAIRLVGAPPDTIKGRKDTPTLNSPTPGRKAYATNTEWFDAGLAYLTKVQKVTPRAARIALEKYLGIKNYTKTEKRWLSQQEASMVLTVVSRQGPPPKTPTAAPVKTAKANTQARTSSRRDTGGR